MVFVEQRVNDDEGEGGEKPAICQRRARRSTKSPRGEIGENGVFSEVRDLADDEMDHRECFRSSVWEEPEYEWTNDARRVVGGEAVGRRDGDEDQPDDERKVTAEKSGH